MSEHIRVLPFAGARDVVGAAELVFELGPATTVGEVFDAIAAKYPGLVPYKGCLRLAVNGAYASSSDAVHAGDEVALIPPVSGG